MVMREVTCLDAVGKEILLSRVQSAALCYRLGNKCVVDLSCRNMQNFEPCGVLDITSDWDGRKGTKACSVAALQVKFEPPPA